MTTIPSRRKIILLVCGGFDDFSQKNWQRHMPELSIMADVEPVFVSSNPTNSITPSIWEALAQAIYDHYHQADGFVVLHDVDNLLFTSAALSFQLQKLSKPIIFTGALGKQAIKTSEVRGNIINAIQAVSFGVPEVSIMFGNRLIRASTATRSTTKSLNAFTSPNESVIGKIYFSIRVFTASKGSKKIKPLRANLEPNVATLVLNPLFNVTTAKTLYTQAAGVVIDLAGFQQLPEKNLAVIADTTKAAMVLWAPHLTDDEAPKKTILVKNMTWHSTVTKLMWALKQTNNQTEITKLMVKDITGELL